MGTTGLYRKMVQCITEMKNAGLGDPRKDGILPGMGRTTARTRKILREGAERTAISREPVGIAHARTGRVIGWTELSRSLRVANEEQDMSNRGRETTDNRPVGIQVIARAAAIMRALSKNPQGLSLAAIAQLVDLPRSTVQRIVCALEGEYLIESLGPNGGFRLGPAFGQLINQTQTDIISLVKPYLTELFNQLQESVCLCSLSGDRTYVIDRIVAERELRVVFPIGIQVPAYATAPGKVLLAELPTRTVKNLLPGQLPKHTPKTLDLQSLLLELEKVHKSGFASERQEHTEGICSYAARLDTYLGAYAITVAAPSSRAVSREKSFKEALLACKEKIERAIGNPVTSH